MYVLKLYLRYITHMINMYFFCILIMHMYVEWSYIEFGN
jgi:hypothetical protein